MESESLITTREINNNTENFIAVKETVKDNKTKLNLNRITEFH